MPHMNYLQTNDTCIKDSQFKSAQQRAGKVKTTSIILIEYVLHIVLTRSPLDRGSLRPLWYRRGRAAHW